MRRWTGWILTAVAALFLIMDGAAKVARAAPSVEGTLALGFPDGSVVGIGLLLLAGTAVYLFPRTAPLGAVLLTGYLGGAIAAHVRMGNPLFSHTLFPAYLAALLWAGLALRDPRVVALFRPLRPEVATPQDERRRAQ